MLAFARQGESNDQKFTLFSCFINSMASMSCVSQAVPFTSRTIFASHLSLSAPPPPPPPTLCVIIILDYCFKSPKYCQMQETGMTACFSLTIPAEPNSLHFTMKSVYNVYSVFYIQILHDVTSLQLLQRLCAPENLMQLEKNKNKNSLTLLFFCSIHINLSMKCKKAANPHRETEEELINYQH